MDQTNRRLLSRRYRFEFDVPISYSKNYDSETNGTCQTVPTFVKNSYLIAEKNNQLLNQTCFGLIDLDYEVENDFGDDFITKIEIESSNTKNKTASDTKKVLKYLMNKIKRYAIESFILDPFIMTNFIDSYYEIWIRDHKQDQKSLEFLNTIKNLKKETEESNKYAKNYFEKCLRALIDSEDNINYRIIEFLLKNRPKDRLEEVLKLGLYKQIRKN